MSHLTGAQLVDAVEGTLDRAAHRHLDACEACLRDVAELSLTLDAARLGPVPEPSPLFWEHFSARVRRAIREEARPDPTPSWQSWLGWRTLAPAGAMAALVVALLIGLYDSPGLETPGSVSSARAPEAVESPAGESDGDVEWRALADLVGPLDWDTAGAAGLTVVPGDTELAVLDLTDEERRTLTELIAGEMARLKS